jgi:hypothetical protein
MSESRPDSRAANQQKTEPVPPSPAHGSPDDVGSVPAPTPADVAAEGTSEESAPAVPDSGQPAVAPPGLADGEPDTRGSSTGIF